MTQVNEKRITTTISITTEMFKEIETIKNDFFSRSACVRRLLDLGIKKYLKDKYYKETLEAEINKKVIKKMDF